MKQRKYFIITISILAIATATLLIVLAGAIKNDRFRFTASHMDDGWVEVTGLTSQQENDKPMAGTGGLEVPVPINLSDPVPDLFYSVYRVQKGDMISIIAEKNGISQDTLISVNNIKQTRLIQIGQYLRIPSMPGIIYTTKSATENPETIAQKYKVSPEKLAAVNKIAQNASFSVGTTIFVPDAALDWVTRQEINGDLFARPLKGAYYLSSYYGWRNSPFTGQRSFHNGIDLAARQGTPIYATLAGTVTEAGWSNVYGNYVVISHHSGYRTLYGHMSKIGVTYGRQVLTGTKIGEVGNTGMSTAPHLHFTVFKNGKTINPLNVWN